MIVVSDASPIIALAAIGELEIIHRLYDKVIIPERVYQEISIAGQTKPGSQAIQTATWIEVRQATNHATIAQLAQHLDAGEAEAIALAIEIGADRLLIDEHRGRAAATQLGLTVIGLLGALLVAKHQGIISAIKPILDLLRSTVGFRVSNELYARVLQTAGE
jgi:predicted nucleic acid-binding protein